MDVIRVYLESLVYHFFRQLWLVLGVKLMEINSNWFSRYLLYCHLPNRNQEDFDLSLSLTRSVASCPKMAVGTCIGAAEPSGTIRMQDLHLAEVRYG